MGVSEPLAQTRRWVKIDRKLGKYELTVFTLHSSDDACPKYLATVGPAHSWLRQDARSWWASCLWQSKKDLMWVAFIALSLSSLRRFSNSQLPHLNLERSPVSSRDWVLVGKKVPCLPLSKGVSCKSWLLRPRNNYRHLPDVSTGIVNFRIGGTAPNSVPSAINGWYSTATKSPLCVHPSNPISAFIPYIYKSVGANPIRYLYQHLMWTPY